MLTELHIKNFAIIDHLEITFSDGLITLTGETGAGKSIILDAIETLLGGRADDTQIRSDTDRAQIEATFRITKPIRSMVHEKLNKEDLLDDTEYLTMGREIRRNNRNISRVNGRSVNLTFMRELGEFLVDIHGQSEHLSLLRVSHHIDLLDRYAGVEDFLAQYQSTYSEIIRIQKELKGLREIEISSSRRVDLLTFQINEIESANLLPGEDLDLKEEHNRLSNAESLNNLAQNILHILDDGLPENPTTIEIMGKIVSLIENITQIDPSQIDLQINANQILDALAELNNNIRNYNESIEFNPNKLFMVEDRITLINNFRQKYGDSIEDIQNFKRSAKKELEAITTAEERILELENQLIQLHETLAIHGSALSKKRRSAAERLQKSLEKELNDLHMSQARINIDFQQTEDINGVKLPGGKRVTFDSKGFDTVEFLIETNPGEGYKPLVKIASGGETSRFMLALKNVLARADLVPTLIFDEIDQGIGGRVGAIVGEKLWSLSRKHQVMCVTHLPQLAAFGKQHYKVDKTIDSGRTITKIASISGENRKNELAQMLGKVSAGTLQSAQEIVDSVSKIKSKPTDQ